MHLIITATLMAATFLFGSAYAANTFADVVIAVDVKTGSGVGQVNRKVLGNNVLAHLPVSRISAQGAGMWDPVLHRGVPEMIRMARDAGVATLRWPGGCGVHEFNWKLTVGPIAERSRQPFGLPEFLRVAEEIGAKPVITVADYWGGAEDAADLVEYLNAPLGKNPNGGVDWAAVRAADGHPEPYGVEWFEYGNETAHGAHPSGTPTYSSARRYVAEEYARRYRTIRAAMRAVDSSVKLGAVIDDDVMTEFSRWTRVVIKETGDIADFYIHHPYLPGYSLQSNSPPAAELFKIALASPRQFDVVFKQINDFIGREAKRRIPLAITEYNGNFVQDRPVPYRLALGTAVQVADLIQVLLKPGNNVAHAEYWQFANEYWGMVKGYGPPYTLRPAYHVFRLYHEHLGDELLETRVESDGYEQDGGFGVVPARGGGSAFELLDEPRPLAANWKMDWIMGARASMDAQGELGVEISTTRGLNYHHAYLTLPAEPMTGYRVSAEIRAEGLSHRGAQIQVGDARGWQQTRSASLSDMVNGGEWTTAHADYLTLPDTKEIRIMARRLEGAPEAGRFWVRNVRMQHFRPFVLPKVPYVGAMATRRDNHRVAVFLINRRIDAYSPVRIDLAGAGSAVGWTLSGPSVDATNESDPENVRVRELAVDASTGMLRAALPPHSFSVIEFDVAEKKRMMH